MKDFVIIDLRDVVFEGVRALQDSSENGIEGAKATLQTFYYALNNRSLELLDEVWDASPLVQLDNPLGGIVRGFQGIHDLYQKVVEGTVRVQVSFTDVIAYAAGEMIVFTGREIGTYAVGTAIKDLEIRTTRIFVFTHDRGWRQIHHHGSIDNAQLLADYQKTIAASA